MVKIFKILLLLFITLLSITLVLLILPEPEFIVVPDKGYFQTLEIPIQWRKISQAGQPRIAITNEFSTGMSDNSDNQVFFWSPAIESQLFSKTPVGEQTAALSGNRTPQDNEISLLLPPFPSVTAESVILLEAESGILLGYKNPDMIIPPASLTKLMTIHVALVEAKKRGLSWDERVEYGPEAWAENAPPRSSLMFLGPDQDTSLREILLGLAVSSGNDAAVGIAQFISGSVPAFVGLMNESAKQMGLTDTYFEEPSGYSEFNQTTARDFARFIYFYLGQHPDVIDQLHSVESFTYPTQSDLLGTGTSPYLGITQYNRNGLVFNYPGADGLKTGYIDESGYNLAATAKRGEMRLIALILGAPGETPAQGAANREADAVAVLNYGFDNFIPRTIQLPKLNGPEFWFTDEVEYNYQARGVRLPLPTRLDSIRVEAELPEAVAAPVPAGTTIGYRYLRDPQGGLIGIFPLNLRDSLQLYQGAEYTVEMLKAKIVGILGRDLPIRFIPVEQL